MSVIHWVPTVKEKVKIKIFSLLNLKSTVCCFLKLNKFKRRGAGCWQQSVVTCWRSPSVVSSAAPSVTNHNLTVEAADKDQTHTQAAFNIVKYVNTHSTLSPDDKLSVCDTNQTLVDRTNLIPSFPSYEAPSLVIRVNHHGNTEQLTCSRLSWRYEIRQSKAPSTDNHFLEPWHPVLRGSVELVWIVRVSEEDQGLQRPTRSFELLWWVSERFSFDPISVQPVKFYY